jgi:hypothetical protein
MTPHITEEISIRSVDRFVLAGNMKSPRDPEEDEDDDRADEPPVVREPDED